MGAMKRWISRRRVVLLALLALLVIGALVFWLTRAKNPWPANLTIPAEEEIPPALFGADLSDWMLPTFSPDSACLYYTRGEQCVMRSLRDESEQNIPLPSKRTYVAISGDGKWFGIDRPEGTLFVADGSGGKPGEWMRLETGGKHPLDVASSSAGSIVAITTRVEACKPGTQVDVVRNHTLELFPSGDPSGRRVLAHNSWCPPPAFSGDGRFIAWTDQDTKILNIWRVTDGQLICSVPVGRTATCALSEDGEFVAYADNSQMRCHVWSVAENKELANWPIKTWVGVLVFHPNGTLIIGCTHFGSDLFDMRKGTLLIHNPKTGKTRHIRTNETGYLARVLLSPDGHFLATVSGGYGVGRVSLWRWDQFAP
jgi:WD40 repeat protein